MLLWCFFLLISPRLTSSHLFLSFSPLLFLLKQQQPTNSSSFTLVVPLSSVLCWIFSPWWRTNVGSSNSLAFLLLTLYVVIIYTFLRLRSCFVWFRTFQQQKRMNTRGGGVTRRRRRKEEEEEEKTNVSPLSTTAVVGLGPFLSSWIYFASILCILYLKLWPAILTTVSLSSSSKEQEERITMVSR